ncbi:ESX secretion-associated protein EspG [Actinophytocola sediminis]
MRIELSLAALDILWEDLRLGQLPFPLEVRSHGDTVGIRNRIRTAVYADLSRRGLATGTRPDDGLVEKLRLLADPAVAVDLVALLDLTDTEPVRALAVVRGRHGLVAVQQRLTVSLRGLRAERALGALLEQLPSAPAGTEKSVTRPAAFLRAERARGLVHAGGVLRTVRPPADDPDDDPDDRERPVVRAGQLGLTRVDESGRRHREPGIGWFDTADGRYATTMTPGPDGTDWITVWPADTARLAHRLTEELP